MTFRNIYLFLGVNKYQIDQEIKQIIEALKVDELSLAKYNCDETPVDEAIHDCMTLSFFENTKVVIIQNPLFLSTEKSKVEHDLDLFARYIEKPNQSTVLIINACELNIDKRKTLVKSLLKKVEVKTFDNLSEDEVRQVIKNHFSKLNRTITFDAMHEFIERTECDTLKVYSELEKLSFYLDTKQEITIDDIKLLISEPLENNIFNLTNEIIEGKRDQAIKTYHKLMMQNEEPIVFSAVLGKNFHSMYMIKQYQKKGYSEFQLKNILKMHPFQLKKLYQLTRMIKETQITRNIDLLNQYDLQVKTGRVDKYLGFELFILNQ